MKKVIEFFKNLFHKKKKVVQITGYSVIVPEPKQEEAVSAAISTSIEEVNPVFKKKKCGRPRKKQVKKAE